MFFLQTNGSGVLSFASVSAANTPAFSAKMSANQNLNNGTDTKIIFDTKIFDTDTAFSTTNYRFTVPSGKAGKYVFVLRITGLGSWTSRLILYLYKNGSGFIGMQFHHQTSENGACYSTIADCAVGDYFEIYSMQDSGSTRTLLSDTWSEFSGYRLIGV